MPQKEQSELTPSFWMASMETRNFFFEAFGHSEQQALEALQEGLVEHARQYRDRISPNWYFDEFEYVVRKVGFGCSYRDRDPLKAPPGTPEEIYSGVFQNGKPVHY